MVVQFRVTTMRYFFDFRQGDEILPDDEGTELPSLELAQEEAARFLAELTSLLAESNEADAVRQHLAIEVRDELGRSVLKVMFHLGENVTKH
jgi:hypothetical protein